MRLNTEKNHYRQTFLATLAHQIFKVKNKIEKLPVQKPSATKVLLIKFFFVNERKTASCFGDKWVSIWRKIIHKCFSSIFCPIRNPINEPNVQCSQMLSYKKLFKNTSRNLDVKVQLVFFVTSVYSILIIIKSLIIDRYKKLLAIDEIRISLPSTRQCQMKFKFNELLRKNLHKAESETIRCEKGKQFLVEAN